MSGEETVLYQGIPAHLEPPLLEWIRRYESHSILRDAALRAEISYAPASGDHPSHRIPALLTGIQAAPDRQKAVLDLIDGILFLVTHRPDATTFESYRLEQVETAKAAAKSLEKVLRLGSSNWRVVGDHLEARVDDTVREAVERARQETASTSASIHLGGAWIACYGRSSKPGLAYSESIKAVEAAAAPAISPKDLKATLGTMLGQLRPTAALWRFAIAPHAMDPVISAMAILWDGQTDRHGGNRPTTPITQEAAQASVLLAATLVHWFATGAVSRH